MTVTISPDRLGSLFRPRRVALVGASDKSAFSFLTFRNLVEFGFGDQIYLVNRRGAETHGRATVTSCAQIGEPVDVAFLMLPQEATLDALSDAAAAGIRSAVILTSGYGETGAAGRQAEAELAAHAACLDMVVLGPNHLGFANFVDGIPVTPIPGLPREPGPVALLSQSGASSSAMLDFATMSGVGLSSMVTLGNEAMITAGHVLDYLVDDEHTRAVAIFMEAVRQPDVFRAAARRAARAGKAVVALKAGSSALSARTAAAHTGALVGDDRAVDAVFHDLGVIRVDSIEDMLLTAGAAAYLGRLERPGLGVVSISGGACGIFADRAADLSATLAELAPATHDRLAGIMPDYGTVQNPLDVTGAAILDPTIFTHAIEAMSADPAVGVVAVINALPWQADGGAWSGQVFANAIGEGIRRASRPVVYVNQVLQPITTTTKEAMAEARVPYAIPGLRQAVVALRNVAWWSGAAPSAPDPPGPAPDLPVPEPAVRHGAWSEAAARELLAEAGIPVVPAVLVTSPAEAVRAAAEFDGPVALKLASPDAVHKTDLGGVRLDVRGDGAVAAAFEAIQEAATRASGVRFEGVLVSPMRPAGTELLIGVARDPTWGLLLAVAVGGVLVEVLDDVALTSLPIPPSRARDLLLSLRGASLLRGARGAEPVDLDAVAQVVARVGDLALALGDDVESLEVNPLRVDGATVEALDATVTWTRKENV